LAQEIPAIAEVAAKLIDALTAKQQANAAEEVMKKVVEALTGLAKDQVIDKDTLLSTINGLSIDKDFTLIRGQKKSVTIKLGGTRAKQSSSP